MGQVKYPTSSPLSTNWSATGAASIVLAVAQDPSTADDSIYAKTTTTSPLQLTATAFENPNSYFSWLWNIGFVCENATIGFSCEFSIQVYEGASQIFDFGSVVTDDPSYIIQGVELPDTIALTVTDVSDIRVQITPIELQGGELRIVAAEFTAPDRILKAHISG